jgi:tetratricopeptide (TPR) repeat protein
LDDPASAAAAAALQPLEGDALALPARCKLQLGACGSSIPTTASSSKRPSFDVSSIGWNVVDVDLAASNLCTHHGLYDWLRLTPQFMNARASQNMADALRLNPSFSVVDPHFGSTTPLKYYDEVNAEQSRAWAISRIKIGNRLNKAGEYAEAKMWYRQAITLDRNCADAWVAKATAHANLKQYDKAITHLERALEVDANVRNAKEYLESVRAALAAARREKEEVAHAVLAKAGDDPKSHPHHNHKRKDMASSAVVVEVAAAAAAAAGSVTGRRTKRAKRATSSDSEEEGMQADDIDWPVPRAELVFSLKKMLAGKDPDKITLKTLRKKLEGVHSVKFTKPMRTALQDIIINIYS